MKGVMLCLALAGLSAAGAQGADPRATPEAEKHQMSTVYLVLLKKGPGWTAEETAKTRAVQEAHRANIRAMWEAKKLIIAGPLGDGDELRGIFLFQVETLEEAKALAASDPAVKAGRLVAEVHPWWVERRALPAAGSYCQVGAP